MVNLFLKRVKSVKTLFLLYLSFLIFVICLPLLVSGLWLMDNITYQLGTEILVEKLAEMIAPVDQRYARLRKIGLEDSVEHANEIKRRSLSDFSRYRYKKSGVAFVISGDRDLMTNIHSSKKPGRNSVSVLGRKLTGKEGIAEYTVDGSARLAVYRYYAPWDSYIGLSIAKDELFEARNTFARINIFLLVIVVVIGVISVIALNYLAIVPLIRLTDYAAKVAGGDYGVEIHGRFFQEFNTLKNAIANMVANIRQKIDETMLQLSTIRAREKERDAALKELWESRERLQSILDNTPALIYLKDKNGKYITVNRRFEKLFNITREEIGGKTDYDIFSAEIADTLLEHDRQVLERDEPCDFEENVPVDGIGVRTYISVKFPLHDDQGRPCAVCGISTDITERLEMEKELHKNKKLEAVGVLAGGIAHDFNNLLTAIQGNIYLAREIIGRKSEAFKLLQEAEKATVRSQGLTQQLLTFSKGGAPVREAASIEEIITDSAGFVLSGGNVDCRYHFPDDLWRAEIDKGQISQVVQNLIINAAHAMPTGGTINITCENHTREQRTDSLPLAPGNYIKIVITDHGKGIAEDHLAKIFDPYFTTKDTGQGLGLAVSHSIIVKHGGHISAASEEGVGTTFTVYLPASEKKTPREFPEDPGQVKGSGRVMVMDDEEIVRDVARAVLENLGYQVVIAKEGKEAIVLYQEASLAGKPIDLIIMDLTIPGGMGGKETAAKILEIEPTARIIVSSGYSNDPVMANYRRYGFKAAVAKPYSLGKLGKVIKEVMSGE